MVIDAKKEIRWPARPASAHHPRPINWEAEVCKIRDPVRGIDEQFLYLEKGGLSLVPGDL